MPSLLRWRFSRRIARKKGSKLQLFVQVNSIFIFELFGSFLGSEGEFQPFLSSCLSNSLLPCPNSLAYSLSSLAYSHKSYILLLNIALWSKMFFQLCSIIKPLRLPLVYCSFRAVTLGSGIHWKGRVIYLLYRFNNTAWCNRPGDEVELTYSKLVVAVRTKGIAKISSLSAMIIL